MNKLKVLVFVDWFLPAYKAGGPITSMLALIQNLGNELDIVIVTDESEVNDLVESLRTGAVSPMSYSDNLKATLPKEILDEDEVVAKYPLEVREVKVVNIDDTFLK